MSKALKPKMKSRLIAAALRQKIRSRKLPPGLPLPSAHELAVKYKVCMMTANRALDLLEQESLIIRRKGSGNFVRKNIVRGRRLTLGLADGIEHSENYARTILMDVFPETALACFKAENCDCRIIPYSVFRDHDREALAELDGLLAASSYIDDISENFIRSLNIPIVLYRSEYERDFPFPQVIPDHSVAMDRLFALAEQEKISGIMIFCHLHKNGLARCEAFKQNALRHHFTEQQILSIKLPPLLALRQKVLPLLPEIPGKLLIVCSALMTCELVQICSENGLICGKNYQLVSYDNLSKNLQMPRGIPEVTSIDYSRTAAAKTAAKLLIQTVRNPHSASYQTIKFPTRLMIRESAFQTRKELVSI